MRADIVPGGTFPDYQLTDHAKMRRRLSELQGDDPMVLLLSRGHFCPKDNQQHLRLAPIQSEVAGASTRLVPIKTHKNVPTPRVRHSLRATRSLLLDPGRKAQQEHDIQ